MKTTIGAALLAAVFVLPSAAWGPKTQLAINTAALHLMSKEANIPLTRIGESVRRGAMESEAALMKLYPDMLTGPIQAIESEMLLLKAVRGERLDHYFAYRLGMLGKLVAETTAPMREAKETYRNLYYTDVERAIESTSVANRRREKVDPALYFSRRIAEANANNDMIEKEYESGIGIEGVAGALLPEDTSRSARAVADVWMTILTDSTVSAAVSDENLREYFQKSMQFYAKRKNAAAMESAEERYAKLVTPTPEYLIALGDAYFEADYNEQAIRRYKEALAMDPTRRDVVGRISGYYVAQGDEHLENEELEAAREAYAAAADANPLHETAERSRLRVAKLIEERDERRAANQERIERAEHLAAMADEEAIRGRDAEAIDLLREAEHAFQEVTDEFALEANVRDRGIDKLRRRVQELKEELMVNAADFSGTGFVQDVPHLVEQYGQGMDEAGLRAILDRSLEEEYAELSRELAEVMRVR